jgi:chromosome segregation ATPase
MLGRLTAAFAALVFACAPPLASCLRAQDPPTAAVGKQDLARAKFKELTERMQKLMGVLQSTEPEGSKILSLGLRFAQEKKLQARLDAAGTLLQQERWDEALVGMTEVKADLAKLLELLQNRDADLRKLLEEIERLSGLRDRVEALAKEQGEEKDDSARAEALKDHLADIEAKKQAIAALLAEQQKVREQTNELGTQAAAEAAQPLADKEGKLQEDTDKLAKALEATERKDAELKKDAAAREAKAKAAKDGKPSDGKESKPSEAKPNEAKPSDPKDGEPKDGKPSEGGGNCSGSAGKASQSMAQAQKQLGDKKPESSLKDQDHAIEALKQAQKELEKMAEEAQRELLKLPFEQQAKKQEQTQHATDTLAKDMEKADAQQDENGEPKQTPGKKRVQQAVPKQKAAAGQLKEYKPAKQKQQDAKEDLEAAQKELEEAIAQLRQQLQDEVLRALEERFTAMLARQRELSAQTKTLHGTRNNVLTASGDLPAALVARIGELATGEDELRAEASDAHKLIEEDGTTATFGPITEQLRDDLAALVVRLRGNETGVPVQSAQREIEEMLELLINALRKTIELKEGGH